MKKKLLVMLLSALVVLSIGQAAFAGSKAGLSVGYVFGSGVDLIGFEVFGEYQFSKLFSLGGDMNMVFIGTSIVGSANLMGKFNIYGNSLFNVGALVNVTGNYDTWGAGGAFRFAELHLGPGIYGEVNLFGKLNISAAAKFTMLFVNFDSVTVDTNFVFRPTSIHLAVSYGITDNIALGVKGLYSVNQAGGTKMYSVGVTAEYRF
jgi:hypothetical protein